MLRRRPLALVVVTLAGFGTAAAMASVSIAPAQTAHQQAKLKVGVSVLRFSAAGRRTTATGLVSAKLIDNKGRRTTVHSKVALTRLHRRQLQDPAPGPQTAQPRAARPDRAPGQGDSGYHRSAPRRVLGSLFCKPARAKVAAVKASAARQLNTQIHRHQSVLRFSANLNPQLAAHSSNATCPVLDLIVGPLNLQLLGLVVDLQKVHLNITATRGGGALGDLFCQLADNSTTTTTASTT
jgi:hypothetical protein